MKLIFVLMLAIGVQAQTQVPSGSISYAPVLTPSLQILTPTGPVMVPLTPNIILDMSGPTPVLRAATPAQSVKPRTTEVFRPGTTYKTVTISLPPDATQEFHVYRNGLLMAPTIDYTRVGQVVTFTPAQGTATGDVVQVSYGPA